MGYNHLPGTKLSSSGYIVAPTSLSDSHLSMAWTPSRYPVKVMYWGVCSVVPAWLGPKAAAQARLRAAQAF